MRIGICDDLVEDQLLLEQACNQLGYTDIVRYNSGEEFLADAEYQKLHLLFLDIEMDGKNGLEIKEILEHTRPQTFVVFCTTHTECMPDAFGRNVISFLTKPFTIHMVERCIKKALYLGKDFYPITITKDQTLCCSQILYVHTENKYCVFYSTTEERFLSRKSLQEWAEELSDFGFCCISRSCLVNLKFVKHIKKTVLQLTNKQELPVSRRYAGTLLELHNQYRIQSIRYDINHS